MQRLHHCLLTSLALAATPLAACDDGSDTTTESVEYRGWNTNCSGKTVKSGGGTYTWGITPNPEDPPGPGWPLQRQYTSAIIQNSGAVLAADFARSAEAEHCYDVCREEDGRWDGGGCVVEGEFDFGRVQVTETRGGEAYSVEVFAEVGLGCSCGG